MAFATIIFGNAGLILVNRSRENPLVKTFSNRNPALWSVIAGALAAMGLVLYVPYLRDLFQVAALGAAQVIIALFSAALGVAWFECYKVFRGRAGNPDLQI